MREERNLLDKLNHWAKASISLRLVIITVLVLLLMIPISFVKELILERSYRQDNAEAGLWK